MDQGSTMKRSAVHNFAPTVTKFCVMWEGQALPHDTKFGNSRCEIVGRRVIFIWSLIHGLRWSGLIKAEPGENFAGDAQDVNHCVNPLRAKFFRGNINIYLHLMSFLHTNKTQVVEIPPRVRQGPAYSTQSVSWLLMSWRRKEPGHQQPWYWPS